MRGSPDAGERCDCKETTAADRAQANTARDHASRPRLLCRRRPWTEKIIPRRPAASWKTVKRKSPRRLTRERRGATTRGRLPYLYYIITSGKKMQRDLGPTPERRFFDMQRVKRRTFSGVVCEQEVYNVPDRIKSLAKGGAPARASK